MTISGTLDAIDALAFDQLIAARRPQA